MLIFVLSCLDVDVACVLALWALERASTGVVRHCGAPATRATAMRKTALESASCEYSDASYLLEDRREAAEALGATAEAIAAAPRRCGDFSHGGARWLRAPRRPPPIRFRSRMASRSLLGKFLDEESYMGPTGTASAVGTG